MPYLHIVQNKATMSNQVCKSDREPQERINDGILTEWLEQLKHSQSGHVAEVTRCHTEFRTSLAEEDLVMASTKLEVLRHAFHKFEQKHKECLNLCPEEQYDQYCSSVVILQKAQLDYEKLMQQNMNSESSPDEHLDVEVGPDVLMVGSGVSNTSSRASSIASARAKAVAKWTALKVKMEYTMWQQELNMQHLKARAEIELNFMKSEQLRLEHQLRDLQLQDDLQSAMAKEEVLAAFEDTPTHQPNQVNVQSPVSCVLTAQLAVASAIGL